MILHPFMLYLFLLVPPIIVFHLIRRRRKRITISSLLLWERLVRSSRKFFFTSRLFRSILLALQILAVVLLSLSSAGLTLPFPGVGFRQDLVLVMDTGIGMQGESARGSRFDEAAALAKRIIRELSPGNGVILLSAGAEIGIVTPYTRDKGLLIEGINGLDAGDWSADLGGAVRTAGTMAGLSGNRRIIVITGTGRNIELPGSAAGQIDVRYIGSKGDNVALSVFSFRSPVHQDYDLDVFLEVTNFGSEDVSAPVFVEFDGEEIRRIDGLFRAGEKTPLAFTFDGFLPERVRAWIDYKDMLTADNEAYGVVRQSGQIRILLVTPGNPYLEGLLRLFPNVSLSVTDDPEAGTAGADIVMYDGMAPAILEPGRYVFMDCFPPGYAFSPAGRFDESAVSFGGSDHPVLRDVMFAGIHVAEGISYTGPDTPLLFADRLPLLSVHEDRGIKWVRLSADLMATDLPLRPAFPILIGNSVEWLLTGRENEIAALSAGTVISGELPFMPVALRLPDGRLVETVTDGKGRIPVETSPAGFYTVYRNGMKRTVAVNPGGGESDYRRESTPITTPGGRRDRPEEGGTLPFSIPLLIAAFLVLILEFYIASREWKE